jgi:hypothetical protein
VRAYVAPEWAPIDTGSSAALLGVRATSSRRLTGGST